MARQRIANPAGVTARPRAAHALPERALGPAPPVVVATDDPTLSRLLAFALEQMRTPNRFLSTGSALLTELLEMEIGAQRPVVILDVDLPGMDGHAVLERLAIDRPNSFLILVLSSHADESVQVRSLFAGAMDHIAKPFNVRVLMAKINRWVTFAEQLASET